MSLLYLMIFNAILVVLVFFYRITVGKNAKMTFFFAGVYLVLELFSLVFIPVLFFNLLIFSHPTQVCCNYGDASVLAVKHILSIQILIILSVLAYTVSKFSKKMLPPVIEVLLKIGLLSGFSVNLFVAIQIRTIESGYLLIALGNLPVFCLYTLRIIENHKRLLKNISQSDSFSQNKFSTVMLKVLKLDFWQQIPLLILFAFPVLLLLVSILLLFGQQTNSIILAFTQTYKHTFSQLPCLPDCPHSGHYLCTVASKGNPKWVKPIRQGYRRKTWIPVNRQLLVANAFEELLEKNLPQLHNIIRKVYDFIGYYIIQTHHTIRLAWVCNIIYFMMKPLEWFFIFSLYVFYVRPEDKIATQYLPKEIKNQIRKQLSNGQ